MFKEVKFNEATAITSPDLVFVCTEKENGKPNMAPVSFFMYSSFVPPMIAFATLQGGNTGANFRRTKKAVIAVPATTIKDAVMKFGTSSGNKVDKLEDSGLELTTIEGCDIPFPAESRIAFEVTLENYYESGSHYLYNCKIEKIVADEEKEGLFAWNGYAEAAPAVKKA